MKTRPIRRFPIRRFPIHLFPARLQAMLVLLAGLAVLAACGGASDAGDEATAAAPARAGAGFTLPATEYPPGALMPLQTAIAAYDDASELLAADRMEGLDARARRMAEALAAAEQGLPEDSPHAPFVVEARRAAEGLAATGDLASSGPAGGDLAQARRAFGEVSRFLMAVAAADSRLTEGRHAYSCPMTGSTFGKWMGGEEMENPYMGQEMLQCGTAADWTVSGVSSMEELATHAEHVHGADPEDPDAVAFFTCPMHPSVRAAEPGACPICGMDLVPVTEGEVSSGVVFVDERRRQAIGVKTAPVGRFAMGGSVEAVGKVVFDETRLTDVSVKYRGWIGQLHVDEPGQAVRRGQPLFTLYSPELYAAQQDFLTALSSQRTARGTAAPDRADYLVRAARERLRLWDLAPGQIDRLAETGQAVERIPILSPASGFVVEKNVVEGAAVEPGEKLFRIAGLDRVWVEAEVYESELPRIEVGQPAVVTFPYLPGKEFRGKVGFIYPYLDGASRTGRVRVELANPDGALKPDMYASVAIATTGGERLAVPESAVLHAGRRDFVFVDLGDGRLRPQRVETGLDDGQHIEILSGLEPGDRVVTSGNFLIAAESRLRLAMDRWE